MKVSKLLSISVTKIVEVIAEVKEICGNDVSIYTGNEHMRPQEYKRAWNLEKGAISRLKNNIILLNKVGKLLRDESNWDGLWLCRSMFMWLN
jgi:hypothetical protein